MGSLRQYIYYTRTIKSMNLIKQTKLHNPPTQNGNCMAAVIASITGIPIEEVIAIEDDKIYTNNTWDISLFCWLKKRGWMWRKAWEFHSAYHGGEWPLELDESMVKDRPYMVIGKTQRFNGEVSHVCIFMNGEMIHDPHPDNTGLIRYEGFEVIERI